MIVLLISLAVLIGLASCLQGATNGALSKHAGLPFAVLLNALVGTAGALAFWLFARRSESTGDAPWHLYLGGAYGVLIVAAAAFAFARLGAGPTTAVLLAAQLTTSLVLDHFGFLTQRIEVTPVRIVGAVLLLAGAVLVLLPKLSSSQA